MSITETDMSLLHRFSSARDQTAFAEIIHRYAGMVFAACHRVLGDAARAEDVSQETFFRLMRKPDAVTQSLGAWLHTAATNLAVDALRSESARKRRERAHGEELLRAQPIDSAKEDTWADISPQVDAALMELPEECRLLLIEHFLRGRPQNELATEAGTSTATMSRRIRAAVETLQQKLRGKGFNVAPLALMGLMHDHALQGVPLSLSAQLGKMTLVSSARSMLGSAGASSKPSVLWAAIWVLAISMAFGAIVALIGGRIIRENSSTSMIDDVPPHVDHGPGLSSS